MDRILIQRAEAITTTKGGIVLPDKAVGKVLQGTVVAVGPGARNPVSCKRLFRKIKIITNKNYFCSKMVTISQWE